MMHFLVVQNKQGKIRLAKFYEQYSDTERQKISDDVRRLIALRNQRSDSNFIEYGKQKLVYRRYAGLFFCACVDTDDNEMAYLEAIHLFVEILDTYFDNVCELDLLYQFYKVYVILDEVFLGGAIEETSRSDVLANLYRMDRLG